MFFLNLGSMQLKTKHQTAIHRLQGQTQVFLFLLHFPIFKLIVLYYYFIHAGLDIDTHWDDLPSVSEWSGLSAVRSPWWIPARCGCLRVWRTCACWIRPPSTCHTVAIKDRNFLKDLHLTKNTWFWHRWNHLENLRLQFISSEGFISETEPKYLDNSKTKNKVDAHVLKYFKTFIF